MPRGTPDAVIETLNKTMNAAFADPVMKAKLADTGGDPLPGSAADFGWLLVAETEKWGKVVRQGENNRRLNFLFEHDLFPKPVSTFRDHAPTSGAP